MGKLAGVLQALNRVIGEGFDPRFDKPGKAVRVGEKDKMQNLNLGVVQTNLDAPTVKLSQFEGMPVITSMSDRTAGGGFLQSINDVDLNTPVRLRGGQDFMFENPGHVWASAQAPSNQIVNLAREIKRDTGQDPLYMPWRMAPSGGDFATMTGETMISYAASAMSKADKKALDKAIKEFKTTGTWDKKKQRQVGANKTLEGWKGVDDPASIEAWRNAPDVVRKEIKNKIFDKEFRNRGGLGLGEARLAVADPRQLMARDGGVQNIGRVFADQDVTPSDHPSYPYGVPGEGVGTLDQDISVFELMPDLRLGEAQELVADPLNPTQQNLRAMQMGPKAGVISEDVLKALSARGVDVGNIDPRLLPGLVAGGVGAAALMPGDAEAGTFSTVRQAFHGSPHDFDKFSTQQIGTGEGAQAYGHGMYFSSSEDIARGYRDRLSQNIVIARDGQSIANNDLGKAIYRDAFGETNDATLLSAIAGDRKAEIAEQVAEGLRQGDDIAHMKKFVRQSDWDADEKNLWNEALNAADNYTSIENPGKLYTVDIPDESYMLDWDKPLSEQPDHVRAAVQTIAQQLTPNQIADLGGDLDLLIGPDVTGADFLGTMAAITGRKDGGELALQQLGVPGISYEGRTSGERNFVVFDDQEVAITNKMATAPVALAVNDFVQRRAEQGSQIALDALEAAATIGSSVAGEFISNASQLGGYLNPFTDAADVRAAGERLAERVQYMPSPDNQVLKPVAEWLRGASDAIESYMPDQQSIDESIPGQMYNALPERAQGVVRSASNLFL